MQSIIDICQYHKKEKNCFCKNCGEVMCSDCSSKHSCSTKKKTIEYLNEDLLNNFKFNKYLGAGGYGSVFEVVSLIDDKAMALKVIEDVNESFFFDAKKEISLMSKIKHPNIVEYYASNWNKKAEILTVCMELCDSNLNDVLGTMDENTACVYFQQICEGLRYLHEEKKIVHRDLKPQNILLKNNVIKLCDFGESRQMSKDYMSLSRSGGFGTPEYLAPEIFKAILQKNSKFDEKIDIWAIGIIFHQMLTKKIHPFLQGVKYSDDQRLAVIYENIEKKELKISELIKNHIYKKILIGCLEKDPKSKKLT